MSYFFTSLSVLQVQRANRCKKSAAVPKEGVDNMEIWMEPRVKMTTVLHLHLSLLLKDSAL